MFWKEIWCGNVSEEGFSWKSIVLGLLRITSLANHRLCSCTFIWKAACYIYFYGGAGCAGNGERAMTGCFM